MAKEFAIELLAAHHQRANFSCGVDALDRYFIEQVSQDMKRKVTACYVLKENATTKIVGYYTLAAAGVALSDLPPDIIKKLPRYPTVPVAKLGRLAVDKNYRNRKFGSILLWDAISRALRTEIAVFALIVDAKDQDAENFYLRHGFINFNSQARQLMLPLAKLKASGVES